LTELQTRSGAHLAFGDIAPDFADMTEEILFGNIWQRPGLSPRDRSMITCTALIATGRTEQLSSHFPRAIRNGVTLEELVEMITHLAFYSGWPGSVSATLRLKELASDPAQPLESR
jgi:4-carboxymuconolactone decarboxylase